jgi:hypothetical protein
VLLPHMVCDALVAGGRRSGEGQQLCVRDGGKLLDLSRAASFIPDAYATITKIQFRAPDDGHRSARNMLTRL